VCSGSRVGEDKGQGDETSNRNEKKQVMVILLLVLPREFLEF
jgi:hypothetical protein